MKTHKEPKKKDYKDGEITKLKKRIAKLLKENNELKGTVRRLEQIIDRNKDYIGDELQGIPVEEVIKKVNSKTKNECPDCKSTNMYEMSGSYGTLVGCRQCSYRKMNK